MWSTRYMCLLPHELKAPASNLHQFRKEAGTREQKRPDPVVNNNCCHQKGLYICCDLIASGKNKATNCSKPLRKIPNITWQRETTEAIKTCRIKRNRTRPWTPPRGMRRTESAVLGGGGGGGGLKLKNVFRFAVGLRWGGFARVGAWANLYDGLSDETSAHSRMEDMQPEPVVYQCVLHRLSCVSLYNYEVWSITFLCEGKFDR